MTYNGASIKVPAGYPTTVIYVDESGVASNDRFFVVGAVKVRRHGEFARAIRDVRDRTGFVEEFKFSRISRGKLPAFFDLVDLLATPSVHLAACIVDREAFDPTDRWKPKWRAHAQVTAQLLRGCIKQRELVSVCMDLVSTPRDVTSAAWRCLISAGGLQLRRRGRSVRSSRRPRMTNSRRSVTFQFCDG